MSKPMLKPCPCCGGSAVELYSRKRDYPDRPILCMGCLLEAVDAVSWNRRIIEPRPAVAEAVAE